MPNSSTGLSYDCRACRRSLAAAVKFCPFCGKPQHSVAVALSAAPQAPEPALPPAATQPQPTQTQLPEVPAPPLPPVAVRPAPGMASAGIARPGPADRIQGNRRVLAYGSTVAAVLVVLGLVWGFSQMPAAIQTVTPPPAREPNMSGEARLATGSSRAVAAFAPSLRRAAPNAPIYTPAWNRQVRAPANGWSAPPIELHAGDIYTVDSMKAVLARDNEGQPHPVLADVPQHVSVYTRLQFQSAGSAAVYLWLEVKPAPGAPE